MGILSRFKFRWSRKHRLLFELGIAVLCLILLFGALNTITYSQKVPILTTKDLWEANVVVGISYYNGSVEVWKTYRIKDIAVYYNDKIILVPPYDVSLENAKVYQIQIRFERLNLTYSDLIERGLNKIWLYVRLDGGKADKVRAGVFYINGWFPNTLYNYTEFVNGTELEITIDTMSLLSKVVAENALNAYPWFYPCVLAVPQSKLNSITFAVEFYAVSEKPVLKALTEPIYSLFSGLWAAILAFWRRVKTVIGSAFGGFSLSAIFTGLIGDPITAMVLTIAIITVMFLVMKKHR